MDAKALWKKVYKSCEGKFTTTEAIKMADSCVRYRMSSQKIEAKRVARRPIILEKPPPMTDQSVNLHKRSTAKCQATTLSNRQCPFRATSECGRFCKKHCI